MCADEGGLADAIRDKNEAKQALLDHIDKLTRDNKALLAACERGLSALAANGAPNCEAAKEMRQAIAQAKGEK